jgi:hypothetical protein
MNLLWDEGLDRFLLLVKYYHYCRFISLSHHIPPLISNSINRNWAYIIFSILMEKYIYTLLLCVVEIL